MFCRYSAPLYCKSPGVLPFTHFLCCCGSRTQASRPFLSFRRTRWTRRASPMVEWKPSFDANLSQRHAAVVTAGALGPIHRPDVRHIHQAGSIHAPYAPNQPSQRSPRHGTVLPAVPGASPPVQPRWQVSPRAAPSAQRGGPVSLFQSPPALPGRCWSDPRAAATRARHDTEKVVIRTQLQQRQVEAEQLQLRLAQLEQEGGRGGGAGKGKGKGRGKGQGRGRGRGVAGPQVPPPAAAEEATTPRAPEQWPLTGRRSGAGATMTRQEKAAAEELVEMQEIVATSTAAAAEADAADAAAAHAEALAAQTWALTGAAGVLAAGVAHHQIR